MKKKDEFYTGLKQKLIFDSMKQHYECPSSTTKQFSIAQNFCDDPGIILKLKATNIRTSYIKKNVIINMLILCICYLF